MGKYDVYVICSECLDVHLMSTGITLEDGPKERQSIASAYAGKRPPPDIVTLLKNDLQCPETGRAFVQEDINQIFLVPVLYL